MSSWLITCPWIFFFFKSISRFRMREHIFTTFNYFFVPIFHVVAQLIYKVMKMASMRKRGIVYDRYKWSIAHHTAGHGNFPEVFHAIHVCLYNSHANVLVTDPQCAFAYMRMFFMGFKKNTTAPPSGQHESPAIVVLDIGTHSISNNLSHV